VVGAERSNPDPKAESITGTTASGRISELTR
jgi:hypothetical protein